VGIAGYEMNAAPQTVHFIVTNRFQQHIHLSSPRASSPIWRALIEARGGSKPLDCGVPDLSDERKVIVATVMQRHWAR